MRKAFLAVTIFFLAASAKAETWEIVIDCGPGFDVINGTMTAVKNTNLWDYTCTDLPRESTYVRMQTPLLTIKAGADTYEAQDDVRLNSGFANRVSIQPNNCEIIRSESRVNGVHALFNRYWHPEFGRKFPVSVIDQNANTSLVLLNLDTQPANTLSISGTILSGNRSCQFKLAGT